MVDKTKPDLLEEAIQAASLVSGAGVCIYDLQSLLSDAHGESIKGYRAHTSDFCQKLHGLPGAMAACKASDTEEAVALAGQYQHPFYHTCHAGLTEIVIPVMHQGELVAVAFCGQVRLASETRWESVLSRIGTFNPDAGIFREYFEALPLLDRPTLSATATLLDLSLRYLVEVTARWTLKKLVSEKQADPVAQALEFIENHYHEGIGASHVAAHLHLDPSYLARLFKRHLGQTITERITAVRMEKARQLCVGTSVPLSSIAPNVGYTSYRYFASVFRKVTGKNPSALRAEHITANEGD